MARAACPSRYRAASRRAVAVAALWSLFAACSALAIPSAPPAGAVADTPARSSAPAAAQACTYPATSNQVLVVIDFGDVVGIEGTRPAQRSTTVCVVASPGERGSVVLLAALQQLGWTPRFEGSMLCGIAGYPATGCGDPSGANYLYWSYWWGSAGGWRYASMGPATSRTNCARVEGWRFINGAANVGNQDWPAGSSLATGMCPGEAVPTTTPATVPASAAPPASSAPSSAGPGGPGSVGQTPGSSSTSTSSPATSTADTSVSGQATSTTLDRARVGAWADVQTPAERGAATAVTPARMKSSSGALIGVVLGVLVLAGVAAIGVVQVRRRTA